MYRIMLIAVCALLVSCTQTSTAPIRIGINPWPGYEFLYLAQEVGIYKKLGLNVKLIEFGALEDVIQGFKRGNVDITCTTLAEVAYMYKSGDTDLRAFIFPDYSNGSDMILAHAGIRNVDDLSNKRIGVEPGTISHVVLQLAAQRATRPTMWQATVIEDSQDNLLRRFKAKELDAITTYPPFAIEARKIKGAHMVFDSAMAPGLIIDAISARATFLNERAKEIGLLKQAWQEAVTYYYTHPDEALAIMAARERLAVDEFKNALSGIKILNLAEQQQLYREGTVHKAMAATLNIVYKGDSPPPNDCCMVSP